MSVEHYDALYHRVVERKGSEKYVEGLLSQPLSVGEIHSITDDRFLSAFTKKVFQSGFVWRVIEQKWPNFEELFFNFEVDKILLMPDEMFEQRAQDKRIVRNLKKVMTIRDNAMMVADVRNEHGSVAEFVTSFKGTDIVNLWQYLKKHGTRLGGNTGPYSLRALGIDTFLLSRDVEAYFRQHDIISGSVQSKRSLTAICDAFSQWQEQSNRSLQELSQLVAFSSGDNVR